MRVGAAAMLAIAVMGCDDAEPSWDLFTPVEVDAPAEVEVEPDAEPTPVPDGSFDFDAADRDDEEGADDAAEAPDDGDQDALQLQAALYGVDPDQVATPEPKPAASASVASATTVAVASPTWLPGIPVGGSWGLRLLATVHDVQPPRAMIALPDGTELVVQPGQMLPDHNLVVLAVGGDAIQVARVTPQGFYAKVETETVGALGSTGADAAD